MKTNQVMIRKMGAFAVQQRTCDGYFNATALLQQWNRCHGTAKEIKEFLRNDQTQEFIDVLKNEELSNGDNSPYLATRGNKGATWMHPYLFIKFAMWINPRFELSVIKFVYDQLIEFRHSAGDTYRMLTSALSRFPNTNYSQVAKGLNYIVFGIHKEGLRQTASQAQLKEMADLERELAFTVDMDLVKDYDQFVIQMRKVYRRKYNRALTA